MKRSFYALMAAIAVTFGAAVFYAATQQAGAQTADRLTASLPASDAVMVLEMKRLMSESLPQILSGKPLEIAKINAGIDKIKTDTGLDLRQFERVAVGMTIKQSGAETNLDPVLLARGTFNSNALLGVAKMGAKGKYREESFKGKTIYIFSPQEIAAAQKPGGTANQTPGANQPPQNPSKIEKSLDRMMENLSKELAVAVYDDATLAIGSVARVREAVGGGARVGTDLLALVDSKPQAIARFGANMPQGLTQFVDLDDDEIGRSLKEVRQLSGALDAANNTAAVSLTARASEPKNAENLEQLLAGVQMIGKSLLGGAQGGRNEIYGRMIDSVKITREADRVMLDLQIPQSDINVLLGAK